MHSVLNNFIALKHRFIDAYGAENLWDYGEYKTCIEYWSSKFEDFYEMFSPLIINEHNNFVLLRYNLMDTDAQFWQKYDGMYRECRSIVIDKENECFVLTPFTKFFNLNETEETSEKAVRERIASANRVEVSDKLDGSMQSARYYNGNFVLAGTSALDPEMSFRVTIGYSLLTDNYKRMLMEHPDYTFIFELICKEDQHVVNYSIEQRGLYLIGVRSVVTGENLSYADVIEMAEHYKVKHTTVFDKTLDEMLAELDSKSSDEAEGFVIDIDGYKVKLKYNDYLSIHRMLTKLVSTNTIIHCIDSGNWDDVRSKMPEAYRPDADLVAEDVKAFIRMANNQIQKAFNNCKKSYQKFENETDDKKSFYMYAAAHYKSIAHYLMNCYCGKDNNFIRNRAGRYLRYYEIKKYLTKGEL